MPEHCEICSINLQNKSELKSHLEGKKHLKKLHFASLVERSIFISPLPKFVTEHQLLNFFYQYGKIIWYRFGSNHATIQFDTRKSADILLNQPIWFENTKLEIKRRVMDNDPKGAKSQNLRNSSANRTCLINYDQIKHIFDKGNTFDNQLREFLDTVSLSNVEIETRYASVCTQLDRIFKVVFPKCKTYKFGSTLTGLGFKECDLDIYMDIGEPVYESTYGNRECLTMNKIFIEVKRVMYKMDSIFSNIISIPKAKTPIIKFWHVPTDVSCDISFNTYLSICKTYLIKYYISLDDRLKPLMMLIKYWARHFGLSGTSKISNYALVLLVIFYLQQPFVNIIPPLMVLQKNCEPRVVDGWQVNFDDSVQFPPAMDNSIIPKLLHGFFSFYGTFDFKCKVICPLDGKTHSEAEFKEIECLPPCMDRYKACVMEENSVKKFKVLRPMCVQDPVELDHNVTASVTTSVLDSFVKYCVIGAEICTRTSENDYRDLMKTLLTTVLTTVHNDKTKCQITISAKHITNTKELGETKTLTNVTEKMKFTESQWYITVFNIVKDIFEKVCKVQVEIFTADTETTQQKIEILSDVHTKEHQKIILQCEGHYCTWRNRKIANVFDPSLSILAKEIITSDKLIETFKEEDPRRKIKLSFTCTFEKKNHPLKVQLILSDQNSGNGVFHEFTCFVKHKLHDIVDQTLTHIHQYHQRGSVSHNLLLGNDH